MTGLVVVAVFFAAFEIATNAGYVEKGDLSPWGGLVLIAIAIVSLASDWAYKATRP